MIWTPMSLWQ